MSREQGEQLCRAADKKLKGNFLGFGKDADGAIDDLKSASNNFKCAVNLDKNTCFIVYTARLPVREAARCQLRIADISEKEGEFYEVASACMEAAKLQIKDKDMDGAKSSLQRAKNLYIMKGKVSQAARACKELGEAMKSSRGDPDSMAVALTAFQEAATLYNTDSQYTEMNKMKIEAASLLVETRKFEEAAKTYEDVGNDYVLNNLLKYSARDHFMNSLLCLLADNNIAAAESKLNDFLMSDSQFENSRHHKLVAGCVEAMNERDPDAFATAVAEWEAMTKLEPFRVTLLLAAKETIAVGPDTTVMEDDDLDLT